jgi:hypothetical protein
VAKACAYVGLVLCGLALGVIPAGSKGDNLQAALWALAIAAFVVAGIAYVLERWNLTARRATPRLPTRH